MEEGESILDTLYEEDHLDDVEDVEDVEMVDVEEGELVEHDLGIDLGQRNDGDSNVANPESRSKKRRAKKKKNKRKRSGPGQNVSDINRFVLDTCRRLKEKKSYMVYTAVGCLGVSALCDLVKEVDAIQACGGQMTADGRRSRTGGGILWTIIKAREPNAYKEIMKKVRDFEKQFKRPNTRQSTEQGKDGSSQDIGDTMSNVSAGSQAMSEMQNNNQQPNDEEKRVSIHDRLRVPVSYDDDILGGDGDQNDDAT